MLRDHTANFVSWVVFCCLLVVILQLVSKCGDSAFEVNWHVSSLMTTYNASIDQLPL